MRKRIKASGAWLKISDHGVKRLDKIIARLTEFGTEIQDDTPF